MNKIFGNRMVVFCCVLLLVNFFLLLYGQIEKQSSSTIDLLDQDELVSKYNLRQLESIIKLQSETNNYKIPESVYLRTASGDSVMFCKELMGDCFVVRFNDIGCSACIEDFFQSLPAVNDFIAEIGSDNVCIIINSTNPRDIIAFRKHYKIKCKVYGLASGGLHTPMESNDKIISFYFFEFGEGLIINSYISIKSLDERNKAYFDSILRRYKK